jgi:hypothetical protein
MAYYIFLKSLRSLEEFRKNPHVKIPPKSPCANFQSLGIFKNQFLFGKEFSPSLSAHPAFRPNLLFLLPADFPPLPHWAMAFRPARPTARPPGRPSPPHAFFLLPHRRRESAPFPPSSIRETGAFNPTIEASSSRPLKALGPPPPRLRPIKADPAPGGAPHTSKALSPSPHRGLAVVLSSRALRRR